MLRTLVLPDNERQSCRGSSRQHCGNFGSVECQRTTEAAQNCGFIIFFLFHTILRNLQNIAGLIFPLTYKVILLCHKIGLYG